MCKSVLSLSSFPSLLLDVQTAGLQLSQINPAMLNKPTANLDPSNNKGRKKGCVAISC